MASNEETASIRGFVWRELCGEPDLSKLTLRLLRERYLAHVGLESLSPEARDCMKQVVAEELMKMQVDDGSEDEVETKKPQNKRKRGKENEVTKPEDKGGCKSGSEESEEENQMKSGSDDSEKELNKSQHKTSGSHKEIYSEGSTDDEISESEKKGDKSHSPKEKVKRQNGEKKDINTRQGRKTPQSDKESNTDKENKSERRNKINSNESSDESENEEKVSVEKKNDTDSDSSSLPSLEDEKDSGKEEKQEIKKKSKTIKKGEGTRGQKSDNKAVVRLKRYIALCGVKRNYKKLLGDCRTINSMVTVLRKELEDLGVHGTPTIQKCKKVLKKREKAQELASLDASNIITTQGRPKRRQAWQHNPPSSVYQHSLNSDSDDQENTHTGRRRATDWANLQGIISDDADSD
ncbi:HIRA-interacting protein 3 isoform X2 [Echeneis naucrates]|uniref:HIRA-interacting protein 3 isoform X2 n=1 Tax=Echeneis naucrates TaxID=173247 RepID=UPI0011138CDA|nr:HIRA-interacting protein 3 isoform X2 [Echeneis naucrates]